MRDDPLAGVDAGVVDAFGRPFCPTCGLDLRGGVCPACDPARTTTPAAKRARTKAERERVELAVGLTAVERAPKNPLVWLVALVAIAVEPAWAIVVVLIVAYLAAWSWWARRKVRA